MDSENEIINQMLNADLGQWNVGNEQSEQQEGEDEEMNTVKAVKDTTIETVIPTSEFVYTREQLLAIREIVAHLPCPEGLSPMFRKNVPGNLAEAKLDQDKYNKSKSSRAGIRERKGKESSWITNKYEKDGQFIRPKRTDNVDDSEKTDETIILCPPRKAFPSSQLTSPILGRKKFSENAINNPSERSERSQESRSRFIPSSEKSEKTRNFGDREFNRETRERGFSSTKRSLYRDKGIDQENNSDANDLLFNAPLKPGKANHSKKSEQKTNIAHSVPQSLDVDSLFAIDSNREQFIQEKDFFDDYSGTNVFVGSKEEDEVITDEKFESRGFGRWFGQIETQSIQTTLPMEQQTTPESPSITPQKVTVEMLFKSVQSSNTPLPAIPTANGSQVIIANNGQIPPSNRILNSHENAPIQHPTPLKGPVQIPGLVNSNIPTSQMTPLSAALLFQQPPTPTKADRREEPFDLETKDSDESISFITSLLSKNQPKPAAEYGQTLHVGGNPVQVIGTNLNNKPQQLTHLRANQTQSPYVGITPITQHQYPPPMTRLHGMPLPVGPQLPHADSYQKMDFLRTQQQHLSQNGMGVPRPPQGITVLTNPPTATTQNPGLEKWFGDNLYTFTAPMPPIPANVKMISVEEIEKQQMHK